MATDYVQFSNEKAVEKIISDMSFLQISPYVSDKIYIKDENGNFVTNKNKTVKLYFYNVEYEILGSGLIYKIKLSILSNSMLPASKNADVIKVLLYLSSDKKEDVNKFVTIQKPILNVLGTDVKYGEFTTDRTYGTFEFKVKNPNGKKAYEYIQYIITQINTMAMKKYPTVAETLGRSTPVSAPKVDVALPKLKAVASKMEASVPKVEVATPKVEVAQAAQAPAEIESTESDLSKKFKELELARKRYSEFKKQKKANEAKLVSIIAKRAELEKEEAEAKKNIDLFTSEMKLSETKIESLNVELSSALKSDSWADAE